MTSDLSARDARRIALAAQGFRTRSDVPPTRAKVLKTIEALGLLQIDSVNVVSRTHYLPLYSRLGAYPRAVLEDLAWGARPDLFEYWGHEASLIPRDHYPLLRWRMDDAHDGVGVWKGVGRFLRERRDLVDHALRHIRDHGPVAASALDIGERGEGGWWGWSEAKHALECLFWTGQVMVQTRKVSFERIYALPETVLPSRILELPVPSRLEAQTELVRIAARAMGIATMRDLRDYHRLGLEDARRAVHALVETGELVAVKVEGWKEPAYLWRDAPKPRPVRVSTLLSPFDNAIWFRERTERLFGVRVVLEIYTPAAKRLYGYYVLPFLEDEAITARVDLKADRKASVLVVQASHAEAWATVETAVRLAAELRTFAGWLGLGSVRVEARGNLAEALGAVFR